MDGFSDGFSDSFIFDGAVRESLYGALDDKSPCPVPDPYEPPLPDAYSEPLPPGASPLLTESSDPRSPQSPDPPSFPDPTAHRIVPVPPSIACPLPDHPIRLYDWGLHRMHPRSLRCPRVWIRVAYMEIGRFIPEPLLLFTETGITPWIPRRRPLDYRPAPGLPGAIMPAVNCGSTIAQRALGCGLIASIMTADLSEDLWSLPVDTASIILVGCRGYNLLKDSLDL